MRGDALDLFLLGLGALHRAHTLYPPGNDQVLREAEKAADHLRSWNALVRLTLVGKDAVAEDRGVPQESPALRLLLAAIRRKGCDSVRIESEAKAGDLLGWMECVGTIGEGTFTSASVTMGRLRTPSEPEDVGVSRAAEAALGYLELLPKTEEALKDLAALRPKGLSSGREIVRSLASHVASGCDLLGPLRSMKAHDEYTFTHALNVCALSSALARAMGMEGEALDAIGLAALCHDVGKERIPREILNKSGRLEPEERKIMDGHPREGARILVAGLGDSASPLLPVVAYQHHMNADGSGYPRPTPGRRPHPASLLVAVADVYDALRTVRPYRGAWTEPAACTVLVREAAAGKLDARYVSALTGILRVLTTGRRVGLSDGRAAVILEDGGSNGLTPKVELDGGEFLDLALPGAPRLDEIRDEFA